MLEAPRSPDLRLAYARALLRVGHRAAAWHEVLVARHVGGRIPEELLADFSLENPAGVVWTFVPLEVSAEAVAPADVPDPRYAGIAAAHGGRSLPLLILLGRPCGECDENGVAVCTDCGGSGWRPSLLGDDDVSCPERDTCIRCGGTKYVLNTWRAEASGCSHSALVPEARGATWELGRCHVCGLGVISSFPLWSGLRACGSCGLFDCRCQPA